MLETRTRYSHLTQVKRRKNGLQVYLRIFLIALTTGLLKADITDKLVFRFVSFSYKNYFYQPIAVARNVSFQFASLFDHKDILYTNKDATTIIVLYEEEPVNKHLWAYRGEPLLQYSHYNILIYYRYFLPREWA